MRRSLPALAALPAALLLSGCGYIGDPLPPLANVPKRVDDVAAIQRGARVIVQFTVPSTTTEEHPIPGPLKVDLRAGAIDQFDENKWAASARQIPQVALTGRTARYEIPAADWVGKDIIFGVRLIAGNGKQSNWSNFVVVPVVPAPATPSGVSPAATAAGVQLTWQAPGAEFRVFRKTEDGEFALAGTVQKPEFLDAQAEFGKPVTYTVQTIAHHDAKLAESELSDPVTITPKDTFAPATPAGVHASAAPNSVELNWDQNTEPDLVAYRVYRSVGSGPFEKLAEISAVPTYSDRAAEAGKTYRYALTAVDRTGNESPRSAAVEVVLP
jgi:hypothetical protein